MHVYVQCVCVHVHVQVHVRVHVQCMWRRTRKSQLCSACCRAARSFSSSILSCRDSAEATACV